MTLAELNSVKHLTYLEYCSYLQKKYGMSRYDYMDKNYNDICFEGTKKKKCSRVDEGLFVHHIDEDKFPKLNDRNMAMKVPIDYQKRERLVYCDYLEHLYLHALILEYPSEEKHPQAGLTVGGLFGFLIPALNDAYSGALKGTTGRAWEARCINRIINDKDAYFAILSYIIELYLYTGSFIDPFHIYMKAIGLFGTRSSDPNKWSLANNAKIFIEINNLFGKYKYDHIYIDLLLQTKDRMTTDGGFYAKATRDQEMVFPLIKGANILSSHISLSNDDCILKDLKEDILSPTFGKEESKQEEKYTLTSNLKSVLKNALAKLPLKSKHR
jgi:hypothetical protein